MLIPGELLTRVDAELANLPPFAATVFVMRISDCTWEDIAAEVGCTVEAAEDIYRLSCDELRAALRE